MKTFSTFETMEIVGLRYEVVRDWINRGYLDVPIRSKGQGGGGSRLSVENVKFAMAFKVLIDAGFKRSLASEIIKIGMKIKK